MSRVFAYGTLIFPTVIEAVLGRLPEAVPARLDGHTRLRMRGAVYPGAIARAGSSVQGRLYAGLDAAALARLDAFEGDAYERVELPVHTPAGPARAHVYRVRDTDRELLCDEPWDPAGFERAHLPAFRAAIRARPGGSAPAAC